MKFEVQCLTFFPPGRPWCLDEDKRTNSGENGVCKALDTSWYLRVPGLKTNNAMTTLSSFAGVWRSYLQNAGKGQNLEHAKDQYLTYKTNGFLGIFIGKPTHWNNGSLNWSMPQQLGATARSNQRFGEFSCSRPDISRESSLQVQKQAASQARPECSNLPK